MADILDDEEIGEIEAVEQELETKEESEVVEKPELPEKYRGKSPEELVRMHQEAEKMMSRQAQEVGEVRKLADELIRGQIKPEQEKQEVDFFENPQEAIRQAVENNPKVLAAEQLAARLAVEQVKQVFEKKHPDAKQIVQDKDFIEWVKKSPIRTQLYKAADAYDLNAADELIGTYKELKVVRSTKDVEADKAARDNSIRSATVDVGGSGDSGKKIYRRADLIRLKINNPTKYAAMEDDINAAYQEGRIK